MPKPHHTQHHRTHLPRHRHRNQQHTIKHTKRVEDEQLPHRSTRREPQHINPRRGMAIQESGSGKHLPTRRGGWLESLEYVILRRIRQSIKQQIHPQHQQSPRPVALLPTPRATVLFRSVLLSARGVKGEYRDASRDGQDNEVFMPRVPAPEQRDVQEHHREQLARFRKDEGDVIDMRQARVAERTRERG
ncbi:hypothetical protein V493_07628, partial [Pseudogymnoascus sp. VKM F-4281 (FW-2241)]